MVFCGFLWFTHHFHNNLVSFTSQFVFLCMFCFRINELRHRLIPLYSYDPTEDEDEWGDSRREEEELAVSKPLTL